MHRRWASWPLEWSAPWAFPRQPSCSTSVCTSGARAEQCKGSSCRSESVGSGSFGGHSSPLESVLAPLPSNTNTQCNSPYFAISWFRPPLSNFLNETLDVCNYTCKDMPLCLITLCVYTHNLFSDCPLYLLVDADTCRVLLSACVCIQMFIMHT